MTDYLTTEQAVAVVDRLGFHVRDEGLLFSALARPAARMFGRDVYPGRELKAAALLSSLARNHSLLDGNKRTSWVLTLAFLRLNGARVRMSDDAVVELMVAAAEGALDLDEIADRLRQHLVQVPDDPRTRRP